MPNSKPYFTMRGISRGALAHGLWRELDANACRLIQVAELYTNREMGFSCFHTNFRSVKPSYDWNHVSIAALTADFSGCKEKRQ